MEVMTLINTITQPFIQKPIEMPFLLQAIPAIDPSLSSIESIMNLGDTGIMINADMHIRLTHNLIAILKTIGQAQHGSKFTALADRKEKVMMTG